MNEKKIDGKIDRQIGGIRVVVTSIHASTVIGDSDEVVDGGRVAGVGVREAARHIQRSHREHHVRADLVRPPQHHAVSRACVRACVCACGRACVRVGVSGW